MLLVQSFDLSWSGIRANTSGATPIGLSKVDPSQSVWDLMGPQHLTAGPTGAISPQSPRVIAGEFTTIGSVLLRRRALPRRDPLISSRRMNC